MQFTLGVPEFLSQAAALVLILFLLKSFAAKLTESGNTTVSSLGKGLAYIVA